MKKLETAPQWRNNNPYTKALKLLTQEDLQEYVQKINDDYLYWDKLKHKKSKHKIEPDVLWSMVKISRIHNAKKVRFGKFEFSFIATDKIQKGLHEFDLNLGGILGSRALISEEEKKRYLISSIMEEAIASSQIEGAVTTRKDAKEMLRKNAKPRNKSDQMILNNYQTIKHLVDIKDKTLDRETFLEIHRSISRQTLDDASDEGVYRDNNDINVVDSNDDEIVYTPPKFHDVPQLMEELFLFFNKNDEERFIHPIIKACIIHFMIGFIHPFVDGNGRTARALFYLYLLKNGYWLTEYLSISRLIVKSKTQYAMAYLYTETDGNDLTYFIDYKIKTMKLAYEELSKYIERKITEKKQLVTFQKTEGINERQAQILKWVNEDADIIFSVKEMETRFNISNQTARTDLQGLEESGYLKQVGINKKSKAFYKSEEFENLIRSK